jgi:nonsense-mediated mRNA decay protein 3
MSGEFCVVCGKVDVPVVDGVCAECAAKRVALLRVEGRPVVVLCPSCGARKVGQVWERAGASTLLTPEDLTPLLVVNPEAGIRKIRWTEGGLNPLLRQMEATVDVAFRGTRRTETVRLEVKIEHRTCLDCSRRTGHFYTAVIQLRAALDDPREKPRALRERLALQWERLMDDSRSSWKNSLSWNEELPEGWDFYLTDTLAARAIARLGKVRLKGTLKESATLWGRKNGQDVYRVTFCLRVPVDGGVVRPTATEPVERQA